MSRRRRLTTKYQYEHVFVRRVEVRCPVDDGHPLGLVRDDVAGPEIYPAHDKGETVVNSPDVPFRLDGTRLRATCPSCRRRGIYQDHQIRWQRVLDLLERMRENGPDTVRVPMDAAAFERSARHTPTR